jgi:hypothetical protein
MTLLGISPKIISDFLTSRTGLASKKSGFSSSDLFLIGLIYYYNELHKAITNAWKQFKENQSEIREQKEAGERTRDLRIKDLRIQQEYSTRFEGQRRLNEARTLETEGNVPLHAGRPHKAKRRFHESIYANESGYPESSSRHLNLPV